MKLEIINLQNQEAKTLTQITELGCETNAQVLLGQ